MSIASNSAGRAQNPYAWALAIACGTSILLFAGLLRTFGVSLVTPALVVGAAALLWLAFRNPTFCLGAILALIPLDPLALLLARFFGPSFLMSDMAKAFDRIIFLPLVLVLWWRNGIKLTVPDWFLITSFGFAVVRLAFGGDLVPLVYDFDFMIAYAAGRVAVLTAGQHQSWARRAVWIAAALSVLGMIEVFFIGEGPRTLLYVATQEGTTEGGVLNIAYHATGYSGLRESSTMIGPLQFGAFCTVALIIWWVYHRNPLLGALIAGGLVLTISRSAWLGAALSIPLLAVLMQQKKRFLVYAGLTCALFITCALALGLSDFISTSVRLEEPSAAGHKESLYTGLTYVLDHPFGAGPGNVGFFAFIKQSKDVVWTENSFLTLAAQYGILTVLCFVGFLVSALLAVWPQRTPLSYAAVGIIVGFSAIMMVLGSIHDVFSLAAWVWFPVGQAVRLSMAPGSRRSSWLGLSSVPAN